MSGVDYKSAPSDYAELFRLYYKYVVNLVAMFGINENNKEDVASDILTTFYARGFLEKFDPSLVFEYKGEPRPARFKSFLSRFVSIYVRGHYDRQARLASREVLVNDMIVGSGKDRWIEVFGGMHDGHEAQVLDVLEEEDTCQGLRNYLARIPPRSPSDSCDLVALFDAVREQCLLDGAYDIAALRERFGVSSTAIHTWMWWLKENLAVALGVPVPPKRPRRIKPRAES